MANGNLDGMKTSIDRSGRIVIPQAIRERAGLYAGVPIEIEVDDDGITLRPEAPRHRLERRGLLTVIVPVGEGGVVTDEMVEAVRQEIYEERMRIALGEDPE
jgi:AbrB family looped-hinge helix DNA binding protein